MKNSIIEVQNIKINITSIDEKDYICITDIAKTKEGKTKEERFEILNEIANYQLRILNESDNLKIKQ